MNNNNNIIDSNNNQTFCTVTLSVHYSVHFMGELFEILQKAMARLQESLFSEFRYFVDIVYTCEASDSQIHSLLRR